MHITLVDQVVPAIVAQQAGRAAALQVEIGGTRCQEMGALALQVYLSEIQSWQSMVGEAPWWHRGEVM